MPAFVCSSPLPESTACATLFLVSNFFHPVRLGGFSDLWRFFSVSAWGTVSTVTVSVFLLISQSSILQLLKVLLLALDKNLNQLLLL